MDRVSKGTLVPENLNTEYKILKEIALRFDIELHFLAP